MKPIDSSRVDVLARPGLAVCNLVKLTTYSNRATRTVSAVYYFAERWTLYDGQQWLPAIRSFEFQRTAMPHLPDPVTDGALLSGLLTQLTVHLRNTVDPVTGAYLIRELSLAGLDGASVEWRELPLNLQGGESFVDLSALLGDEHVVRFRGDLLSVDAVDETDITLQFETPEPQIPWALLSDTANVDPLDLGKRKNIIYGAAKRVPLYGEIVGSLTTLAASAGITDTSLVLTDAIGFPTAGSAMIGTEKVTWSSKSTNTLAGVARGTTGTLAGEHSAGAIIVELVALARFSVASHACKRIVNVYALSPFTGELHRITTAFNSNASAGRVDFTSAQLQLLLDDLATAGATVTQQPAVSTQPVVSHPVTGTIGVMQVVGWSHAQLNDGDAFTVRTPATNFDTTPVWWRWNPPATGAVITSQTFTVRASGAGVLQFWDKDPYLNAAGLVATVTPNNSGGNVGQYVFTTTNSVNQMYVTRSSGNCGVGEAFRTDVQFQQSAPTIPTPTAIAGSDATQVKVRGESVGFGLRLFADVDGYSVPFTSFTSLLTLDSDAANWTIPGGATIANEAAIKSQGTGSLKVTTTSSGAASVRRALTGSPDYSGGRRIAIAIRVENPAQLSATQGIAVFLSSDAFANYAHFDLGTVDGLVADGTFHTVEIDPASADAIAGTGINLSSITQIQFYILNLAGAAASSFYFDDIRVSAIGAASPDYLALQGGLIEKAPDILRHLIATVLGLGHGALETGWNEAGDSTHLHDNVHACALNYMGDRFAAVAGRLAFESRASLILEERITGSVYRMLVADNAYRWPGPVQTITEWAKLSEQSAARRERFSRFRALYAWDASKGDDAEAFAQLVRIDPEQNDVPDPATPELLDTEARIGRRDASVVSFFSIQDQATAREVLGYYAVELSRSPVRRFALTSVPWPEAYLLERGDVVRFAPPWEGGGTVSCRVVDIQRDPFRQLYDFDCVEVPTQEVVQMHVGLTAALIPTARLFVGGEYLLSAALTATLTGTASLTDITVPLACSLTERAIATAQLAIIGGVPLTAALTAALTVTRAQLTQLGPIHMTAALSATLTSNAHLFQSMRCALTATLVASARLEENRFLGGLVPIESGYPYSDAHRVSVNLNGTDEHFYGAAQTLGIANAWTISIAFAATVGTTGDLMHLLQSAGIANQIRAYLDSGALRVYIHDSAGSAIKDYSFGAPGTAQTHALITWNGTALTCYLNGIASTPTQNTNNSGTMTDTARTVNIGHGGAYFSGTVHSVAIWSSVLSTNERVELWNRGALGMRDLARNWRAYASAANLQHWWRLGHNVADIGKDYGRGTPIDVMGGAVSISSADVFPSGVPDGAAVELDGTTEYLANTSYAALGIADIYTVDAWVFILGDGSGGSGAVFAADSNGAHANRVLVQHQGSAGSPANTWVVQAADGTPSFGTLVGSANLSETGAWQHVVFTKSGGTIKLYVCGSLNATLASGVPTQTNVARQVAIGADQTAAHGSKFNGRIHAVRMWDVALSDAAIASLWNGGMKDVDPRVAFGSYAQQTSLKHYWHAGPLGAVGVGGDVWADEVPSGGINLETNSANMTTADTSILRGSVGPGSCLDFNGTNEWLANTTNQALGVANSWTWETWLRCDSPATGLQEALDTYGGTNVSRLNPLQRGDLAGDPFQVLLYDSAGTAFKDHRWDGLLVASTWAHIAVTWDGTNLVLYKDGTAVTASSTPTNGTGTMADGTGRAIYVANVLGGQLFDGRIARMSLWSSVLSATEVRQVWSRRLNVDLRQTFGAYVSQAALKHQWVMGQASALAVDLVASGGIDITTNQSGLDGTNVHTVGF